VELDYSGHHFRILYAMESLTPPDDPYDLPDFKREDQKTAGMIIINASDEGAAAHAIQSEGIQDVKRLIKALKVHHAPIAKYFFTGEGNKLMYKDSILAERVMLRMLESGSTILPVHDSFIVRNSYETELEEIMQEEYERAFASTAKLKVKRTALQATCESQHPHEATIVNMNLKTLFQNLQEYSWETSIWGV
jgi:CRISPR/Cas system endoribonuclease Cas6 (RAMP superfamily)